MKLNKKKKGFTLIELMAVIAIVAILAAVLVPTVSGYITRSKKTAIITQVRNVVNAVEVYNSTAPDSSDIPSDKTIADLITPESTDTVGEAFKNQELLLSEDVSKLNLELTYAVLKAINTDENAMNNIYVASVEIGTPENSKTAEKFVYKNSDKEVDTAIQLER